jgi:hypothetical protein
VHSDEEVETPVAAAASTPSYRWYMYFRNTQSFIGLLIAVVSGVFHLSLLFLDLSRGLHNPYLNIWFHIVLPPFVVIGLSLAIHGAWKTRRRIRKTGLSLPKPGRGYYRRIMLVGAFIVAMLVPFLGFTTYTGYKYTDSVEFCGQACHVPMKPMFTAYQYSAHARVACSSCHIGEGASWFVRSKLSGTQQVFATAFDTFPRPIHTPIKNLRPARETCERCHWPEKAFGKRVVERPHYASDEHNTYRPLRMILNTGGGDPKMGPIQGIHWHYLETHKTEYVALDEERLEIPWVRVTLDEEIRVYRSDGLPADAPPPQGEIRVMDCLDCHNRPSHKYRTPDEILNPLFALDQLDASIPYLKREAARLMEQPYPDTQTAGTAIEQGLLAFYGENYPEIARDRGEELRSMSASIFQAYQRNIFPEMKTDWRSTPDHIGHKYSPGCYRCHDDRHVSDDGSVIKRECESCHEFLESKAFEGSQALVRGEYHHPYALEGAHKNVDCSACHDGGPTPPPTCNGCHSEIRDFMAGRTATFPGVTGDPHPHFDELECIDCHEEPQSIPDDEILPLCMDCHDEEEHTEAVKTRLAEFEALRGKAESASGTPSEAIDKLEKVRPIHNMQYAIKILRNLEGGKNTESE